MDTDQSASNGDQTKNDENKQPEDAEMKEEKTDDQTDKKVPA